jgi:hypothetical protein
VSIAFWLNTAWMLKCRPEAAAFRRAARYVEAGQSTVLREILHGNRDTEIGQRYGFGHICSARQFQSHVPLSTYADYEPVVSRIAAGEQNLLTADRVELLEPTSGTTQGEKLIPYTRSLRRQFQRGVSAWIADLFQQRPAIRDGRAYWSISPMMGPPRQTSSGIPIGFADDTAYLGRMEQLVLHRILAVPSLVSRLTDMAWFRYATLRFLLAASDLSLISVWNPTFLTALLTPLTEWHERLCDDIRRGTLSPPGSGSDLPLDGFRPDPNRAVRLSSIWHSSAGLAEKLRATWPKLALLSCWADAAATWFVPRLTELFPGVEIQGKGLLATEGFVSFPIINQPGAALAVRSHFFEFEESTGTIRLAHEVERGGRYRVVLTTAGGLYRYRLGDEIEITGFLHRCPLLRFLGKWDQVSDLVGEKLAEPHVRAVLERSPSFRSLRPNFMLIVPVPGEPPSYRLYLQGNSIASESPLFFQVQHELEAGLQENPYYRHAVAAGQLGPLEMALLDPASDPASLVSEQCCQATGQRAATIKPGVLARGIGWPELLRPLVQASPIARK